MENHVRIDDFVSYRRTSPYSAVCMTNEMISSNTGHVARLIDNNSLYVLGIELIVAGL